MRNSIDCKYICLVFLKSLNSIMKMISDRICKKNIGIQGHICTITLQYQSSELPNRNHNLLVVPTI